MAHQSKAASRGSTSEVLLASPSCHRMLCLSAAQRYGMTHLHHPLKVHSYLDLALVLLTCNESRQLALHQSLETVQKLNVNLFTALVID